MNINIIFKYYNLTNTFTIRERKKILTLCEFPGSKHIGTNEFVPRFVPKLTYPKGLAVLKFNKEKIVSNAEIMEQLSLLTITVKLHICTQGMHVSLTKKCSNPRHKSLSIWFHNHLVRVLPWVGPRRFIPTLYI